jgi:predicted DNA-binding mobile mystery protein A
MVLQEKETMRKADRETARRRLDRELRYFRLAAKTKNPTGDLLRAVRQALGIPMKEMARKMKINPSVIFRLERSQARGTISLDALVRVAEAMKCEVVYAVVPQGGKTLEELAEQRLWERVLGSGELGS